jgi:hypothetical protein
LAPTVVNITPATNEAMTNATMETLLVALMVYRGLYGFLRPWMTARYDDERVLCALSKNVPPGEFVRLQSENRPMCPIRYTARQK